MYERLEEQLRQIKKMCLNELKQAKENIERYSFNINALPEKLNTNWQSTYRFLIEYDSFLTNITTIMDTTRKFNIQLLLHNMKLTEIHASSSCELKESEELQHVSQNSKLLNGTKNQFFPAEESDISLEADEDFVYPKLNLNEVYKVNDIINGTVTHIKNLNDFTFYIFDNSSKYRASIVELSKSLELYQYYGMPATSEIFGWVLDNQIFRAVAGSKTFYDNEMNEEIIPCYLLDTGEVLPLKPGHIIYRLTNEQRNIPALGLPCQLKNKNPFVPKKTVEEKLKDMEYKVYKFKIVEINTDTLHVEIVDNPNPIVITKNVSDNQTKKNDTGLNKEDQMQLTKEDLDMIYEEPLNTSNAMKAVMGYDPQDDKRICRFYNPETNGCFKGVNCKLEHTLRQPDGWTKDIIPTTSIIDPVTVFASESIINITPTFIGEMDRFFAQINDTQKTSPPLVWNDEDVPSWKLLRKPPHMFELVLSRYIDGLWYRAKIMSHDDDYKLFKVLYVDYGNIEEVDLVKLASLDISLAKLPFKAVLCRLEAVSENPSISVEDRKNCLEIMCEMLLNKSMDVKVISHYEDLFISFVDIKTYPFPDILIDMGYLKRNKNKVTV